MKNTLLNEIINNMDKKDERLIIKILNEAFKFSDTNKIKKRIYKINKQS